MRTQPFLISLKMHFKMLIRKRIVLMLLTVIPCLFIMMVQFTSSSREVLFRVGVATSEDLVQATEVNVALVFVSLATIGFLASFLSLNLVQEYEHINRRLVICGYHSSELILSGLTVMMVMILILVLCMGSAISFFFKPVNMANMMCGMFFTGVIYGSYGLMVGSLVKGQLEGVLSVVLLANIDAGWIQNPLFFNEARNKFIIELLPAYFPSQISIASAFTDLPVKNPFIGSLIYMSIFLGLSLLISYYKMRIQPHVKKHSNLS